MSLLPKSIHRCRRYPTKFNSGRDIPRVSHHSDSVPISSYCIGFSVKMTARFDVNATLGGRMSPIAPGIVPECSGASRVKRAARAGFAALDAPCALWYSMLVGERERSGAPGIRVFMRAPCSHGAHAARIGCKILNTMTALGMPDSEMIG